MERSNEYPKGAGIYKLNCEINGKVYIGKSVNIRKRISHHKNCLKNSKCMGYLQRAILKHGWDSFTVEILETVDNFDKQKDNDNLLERESYYIELFDSTDRDKGYNRCKFSTDRTGIYVSEETRQKLRNARLGKKMSDEHKERLRIINTGKSPSEETREKRRQSMLGRKHSDETIEKMRKANTGQVVSKETREKLRQINLGKKLSEEHKEKLRKPKKTNGNIGKKFSEERKANMRKPKKKKDLILP